MRFGDKFWFREASLVRLAVFRILVLGLAFYDVMRASQAVLLDAAGRTGGPMLNREWQPIYAFEILGISPWGLDAAQVVFAVVLTAIVLGILGLFTRISCAVAALHNLNAHEPEEAGRAFVDAYNKLEGRQAIVGVQVVAHR